MDPRSKLIAAMALSVIILSGGAWALGLAAAAMVAAALWGRLPLREISHASRPALPFIVLVFLLHLLFTHGDPLLAPMAGPFRLSFQGFTLGAHVALQLTLLVAAGSLLTLSTPASELAAGMEKLLRPVRIVKISPQDLSLMLSLALRFIPAISMEMDSLKEAAAARGAHFEAGGPMRRLRAFTCLAAPLCLAVFRRCDDLVVAMEARGYDGGARTSLRPLILTLADGLVIAASAAAAAAVMLC
jgi:biotin transport system permease protein/energy-coupling factor transport system permease protein